MGNMLPLPVFTFKIQMHLYLLASQMPYFRIANAVLSHRKCHAFNRKKGWSTTGSYKSSKPLRQTARAPLSQVLRTSD